MFWTVVLCEIAAVILMNFKEQYKYEQKKKGDRISTELGTELIAWTGFKWQVIIFLFICINLFFYLGLRKI